MTKKFGNITHIDLPVYLRYIQVMLALNETNYSFRNSFLGRLTFDFTLPALDLELFVALLFLSLSSET